MPFLIKNIKPTRQDVLVRNDGSDIILPHGEHVVLDIRNITPEMFLQSLRGEITTLFVGKMPLQPVKVVVEKEAGDELEEVKEVKPSVKKTKPPVSE